MVEILKSDEIICPKCVHQFRAIPEDVQVYIARLEKENVEIKAMYISNACQDCKSNYLKKEEVEV